MRVRGGGPLRNAVGRNCKKGSTTEDEAQVPRKCAKRWMGVTVCEIRLDMTAPPGGGRRLSILLSLLLL